MPTAPQNFHKLLVSLTGIMKDFANYLIDNDRKPRSVKRHINNLERILKYAPNFTQEEIDAYFVKLKEEGRKNTYINSMVKILRITTNII